jgi:hypothetical protein
VTACRLISRHQLFGEIAYESTWFYNAEERNHHVYLLSLAHTMFTSFSHLLANLLVKNGCENYARNFWNTFLEVTFRLGPELDTLFINLKQNISAL